MKTNQLISKPKKLRFGLFFYPQKSWKTSEGCLQPATVIKMKKSHFDTTLQPLSLVEKVGLGSFWVHVYHCLPDVIQIEIQRVQTANVVKAKIQKILNAKSVKIEGQGKARKVADVECLRGSNKKGPNSKVAKKRAGRRWQKWRVAKARPQPRVTWERLHACPQKAAVRQR